MHYRAGTSGFSHLGIPDSDPHWYCECGEWRFPARPGRNGPNHREAAQAHVRHVNVEHLRTAGWKEVR